MANGNTTMGKASGLPGVTTMQGTFGPVLGGKSGGPQLEPIERLELFSSAAASRAEKFEEERENDFQRYEAQQNRGQALREALGEAQSNLKRIEAHPNSTIEEIERAKVAVAKARAKLDAHSAEVKRGTGGSAGPYVVDFLQSREFAQNQWRPAVVPEPEYTFDGDDEKTFDELLSQRAQNAVGIKAAEQAPVIRDLIEAKIKSDVTGLLDQYGSTINVRPATRMFKNDAGRLVQGSIAWPMLDTIIGARDLPTRLINAPAIIAEVFRPQLEKYLIDKAVAAVEGSAPMQDSERRDVIAAFRAKIDVIERQSEIVFCRLRDRGIKVNRFCVRPEVLLQIEKVPT
jgi:hypothetical protein